MLYFLYVVAYLGKDPGDMKIGQQGIDQPPETISPSAETRDTITAKLPLGQTTGFESGNSENVSWPGRMNVQQYRQTEGITGQRGRADEEKKSHGHDDIKNKKVEFSIKPPSEELWKSLYKRHWPQLLSYYDIDLLGRYVLKTEHLSCWTE